ncbi:hypothetical protein IY145_02765 [Methylosinus sp. H3A]|uniref:hypothetical protein n=1 Tax=Methylosinus sp. H3A TaxID=2785786 RepID=UPI0018C201C8|nr:hypothetical protein [Methylosinus sp. H3A]MBG0808296.1 hypothetical protein [Methylosinus sp. H3A]
MSNDKEMVGALAERKTSLLEELHIVQEVISRIKARSDADAAWVAKLEEWHADLLALIESIPKPE